jgi:cytochrome bd ubiquinol oxidase subunit II
MSGDASTLLVLLWLAVTLYAVFGGADFGAGILYLVATGPRRRAQRVLLARVLGPVWEANHVWLIVAITILFTAFPRGFAAIGMALYLPLVLALVAIVVRGASFALRSDLPIGSRSRLALGLVFGAASVAAPFLFGASAGALARQALAPAGRVPGDVAIVAATFPLVTGALAVALCAMLAAGFLAVEAQRAGRADLVADFRRRAIVAALVVPALSLAAFASAGAPLRHASLTAGVLPILLAAGAAIAAALGALLVLRLRVARALLGLHVVSLMWVWGVAQQPHLFRGITVRSAAASAPALRLLTTTDLAGTALLLPALWLLLVVFRRRPVEVTE